MAVLNDFFFFQGLKAGSVYYPGGNANYSGKTVNKAMAEASDHPKGDEIDWRNNIDRVMKWFTEDGLDFVTLYFGEPDSTGHKYGPETEERKTIIKQIDRTFGYIIEAIEKNKLKDKLNVIITSDHGMTTVKKEPAVQEIKLSDYITFSDIVKFDILDYGGFGMIEPKQGKEEEIYQALKDAHPNLKVYRKQEFPEHFHFAKHERILPLLLYGDLGYSVNGVSIITDAFFPPVYANPLWYFHGCMLILSTCCNRWNGPLITRDVCNVWSCSVCKLPKSNGKEKLADSF